MSFNNGIKKIVSFVNDFQVRVLTYKTTRLLFPYINKGERVLDIGSGLGFQAKQIYKKTGSEIQGVDVVDYQKTDIPYTHFDGIHLPFEDKSFDVSYLAFVLHHAEYPIELLQDAVRVTKKRIIILEDTPRNCLDKALDAYHGWSFNKFFGLQHKSIFRSKGEWMEIFQTLDTHEVRVEPLSRFARELYFPISRTRFVLELKHFG